MIRRFAEKDFSKTDGWCNIYPPEYWESNESFRQRLKQFPEGCWAYTNDKDEPIAYMFCHPWNNTVVPLNQTKFKIPKKPTCLYIHDIAVLPKYRRQGIATKFVEIAINIARRHKYKTIKGISVLDSLRCWTKLGFKPIKKIMYGGRVSTIIILDAKV